MAVMASWYLTQCESPLAAYNALQAALLRCHLRRGGTLEDWVHRCAPAFRRRYGWMVGSRV